MGFHQFFLNGDRAASIEFLRTINQKRVPSTPACEVSSEFINLTVVEPLAVLATPFNVIGRICRKGGSLVNNRTLTTPVSPQNDLVDVGGCITELFDVVQHQTTIAVQVQF